ncbi:beta-lactamase-like protein [Cladochytrium replicatum]|nr:beta-lactamase-like protein [Cladochytrium replicatum]
MAFNPSKPYNYVAEEPTPPSDSDIYVMLVEDDRFHENAAIYFRKTATGNKAIIFDSGTGTTGNLREYLTDRFPDVTEFHLFLTHHHFDHIGGAHQFDNVYMSGREQAYAMNLGANSLCHIYENCPVPRQFNVTTWLQDGQQIELDGDGTTLTVLWTPGHSANDICIYDPYDQRLFMGDLLYTWAPVILGQGSNLTDYLASLRKVLVFVENLDEKDRVRLSCGHNAGNLPALEFLRSMIKVTERAMQAQIAEFEESELSGGRFYTYNAEDGMLSLKILDTILMQSSTQ